MKLIPKTRHGKNKIHEAGTDEWQEVRRSDSVICFNGDPGIMIEPVVEDPDFAMWKRRWIRTPVDPDFELA